MRQAGRYMAEYRSLRERYSLLDICRTPDLATEVTLQPVRKIEVDAAILFSDLLLPLEPMGLPFDFIRGEGPQIERPISSVGDIDALRRFEPRESLSHVLTAIRQIQVALGGRVPLIGFAGAPFTLATYLVEGGASRDYRHTKALMHGDPGAWNALMARLVHAVAATLREQIAAGADAVQLFDSWVGTLSPADYRAHVLPHMRTLFAALPAGTPTIHFGTGTGGLLEALRAAGGDVIGLDWRVDLDAAWARVGHDVAVQGNLDPAALLAPIPEIRARAAAILDQAAGRPGHVFNLGHGVLPDTPVDHARALVDAVHELSRR